MGVMKLLCPHGDKDWRCPTCCLKHLRRDLPRLRVAVRNSEKSTDGGSPGFGSRVPTGFSTAALALLQDISSSGGVDGIEASLSTLRDPKRLGELRTDVRKYRSRCALILHDALAPYPLVWSVYGPLFDGKGQPLLDEDGEQREGWRDEPISCPVVDITGSCDAPLQVHRDNDPHSEHFGKSAIIQCSYDDDHEWTLTHGGWLRLGVLLGGVA